MPDSIPDGHNGHLIRGHEQRFARIEEDVKDQGKKIAKAECDIADLKIDIIKTMTGMNDRLHTTADTLESTQKQQMEALRGYIETQISSIMVPMQECKTDHVVMRSAIKNNEEEVAFLKRGLMKIVMKILGLLGALIGAAFGVHQLLG